MVKRMASGRRHRRHHHRRGGSWWKNAWNKVKGVAHKVRDFAKDNQLVSKGLRHFGGPLAEYADHAEKLGYGRRHRRHRRHHRRGGAYVHF